MNLLKVDSKELQGIKEQAIELHKEYSQKYGNKQTIKEIAQSRNKKAQA
jgi:hypothetical protein